MDTTIGKFKLRLAPESNIDWANRYFILRFKNYKCYVGWTGPLGTSTAKEKIRDFLWANTSDTKTAKPLSQGEEVKKAILESEHIDVTTVNISNINNSKVIYEGLYKLIDIYKAYAPYGYNIINSNGKSMAEKEVIRKYAAKWGIKGYIPQNYNRVKPYQKKARPIYQYAAMPHQLYITKYSFVKKWDSIKAFVEANNIDEKNTSRIYMCCNKKLRTALGYVFRFEYEGKVIELKPDKRQTKYDINNNDLM